MGRERLSRAVLHSFLETAQETIKVSLRLREVNPDTVSLHLNFVRMPINLGWTAPQSTALASAVHCNHHRFGEIDNRAHASNEPGE
jgi:hypothetical protein